MYCNRIQVLGCLVPLALIVVPAVAATISTEQLAAQKAVAQVVKNPDELKFGTFTLAGPRGACLTVYKKNWQSIGTHEAFLLRKDGGWEALYIADTPGGHEGCIAEMSARR